MLKTFLRGTARGIYYTFNPTFWNFLVLLISYTSINKYIKNNTDPVNGEILQNNLFFEEIIPDRRDYCVPPIYFFSYIIWALFGNVRDGVIGDTAFNPEQKDTWLIRVKWWLRNPAHNLTWYVIGFANEYSQRTNYQLQDNPGWNFSLSSVRRKLYPFFLYRGSKVTFYFGWRKRGNFGIKFNISSN